MFSEISVNGEWWLPSIAENRVPGSLQFNTRDGARLSLSGKLSKTRGSHYPDFIQGITLDGDLVTLYGCQRLQSQELPFSGVSSSEYYVSFIFVGIHFQNREDLLLEGVHVHYTHLDEWLHIIGFNYEHEDHYDFSINYKKPETINASVTDDFSVSIGFTYKQGGTLYSIYAEQDSYLSVRGPVNGFEYYEKYVELLQNFLCLACSSPIYPETIRLSPSSAISDKETVELQDRLIDLYYQISTAPSEIVEIRFHDMLFTYDDIKDRFESFIMNWILKNEELGPIFDQYFGAINNPYMYTNHKFLSIVQGLESYHRRSFDRRIMPEEEFELRLAEIIDAFPKYRKWLKWKLCE